MNIKAIAAIAALSTALIAGTAGAQTTNAAGTPNLGISGLQQSVRGERGSRQNIWRVRREVERSIDQLQRDTHDFGGHRVQAVALLQQARNQLLMAEQYDKQHPGH